MKTSDDGAILSLMRETVRDVQWLERALQAAIELEHATLPPYLCALWSIKDERDHCYSILRGIVMDEMRHMGLACNLLTTLGGTPRIHEEGFVPTYPGPLPGGVRPGLEVTLAGLSRYQIEDVYMEIEMPERPLARAATYPTIGKFYDAIQAAFDKLDPSQITGQRQIDRFVFPIKSHDDARRAIDLIKRQGEGTRDSPHADPNNPRKLAHYYAFKEILIGNKLEKTERGEWVFKGAPIPFPDVHPMAPVPPGGYDLPAARQFDELYTKMLLALENAWKREGGSVGPAIGLMHELPSLALELMRTPLPSNPSRTYGPCFRFRPS